MSWIYSNPFTLIYTLGVLATLLLSLRWNGAAWERHMSQKDQIMKRCWYSSRDMREGWWFWHRVRWISLQAFATLAICFAWFTLPLILIGRWQINQGRNKELSRQKLQVIVAQQLTELERIKRQEGWTD